MSLLPAARTAPGGVSRRCCVSRPQNPGQGSQVLTARQHVLLPGSQARLGAAHGTSWRAAAQAGARLYDAVVMAVPLELSSIRLLGLPLPELPKRSYQRVVTTVVASSGLRPSYFGVQRLPGEDRTAPPQVHLSPSCSCQVFIGSPTTL